MEARLSRPERATAVIANSDYVAQAVYRAARRIGLSVGGGVSVVGHDDLPTSELLDPPLATLRVDRLAMGRALMQRLLEAGHGDHVAPVEWVERASGAVPAVVNGSGPPRELRMTARASPGRRLTLRIAQARVRDESFRVARPREVPEARTGPKVPGRTQQEECT